MMRPCAPVLLGALILLAQVHADLVPIRAPAVPLVVFDPYISIWSFTDNLYDSWPVHWTGTIEALSGMAMIDGTPYRFMGAFTLPGGKTMQQMGVQVTPSRTIYEFEAGGVQLLLTFMTPAVFNAGDNHDWISRPVTYIDYLVTPIDGQSHDVQLYYDNTAEVDTSSTSQLVNWNRTYTPGLTTMWIGANNPQYLSSTNDRINWGYWYVSTPGTSGQDGLTTSTCGSLEARNAFSGGQPLPPDDTRQPRQVQDDWPVLAVAWDLGTIANGTSVDRHLTIAFDAVFDMEYFGHPFVPYWRQRLSQSIVDLLEEAENERFDIQVKTAAEDSALMEELTAVGGSVYATLCFLVYRQVTGSMKFVWNDVLGTQWAFMKEISSDGDVSTVDVVYPASPFLLYTDPEALRLLLLPILAYANNETGVYGQGIPYNLAWSPHHLGSWPICNIAPNQQEQMPVEETGNMLLMLAAVAQQQGGQVAYLEQYWPLLSIWGNYLTTVLPDPGDQLCTDDFEGPSPHNVNLAAKGIVGLAAYALLLEYDGQTQSAAKFLSIAQGMVSYWLANATDAPGDHTRLQYNLPNTWSMKYNLLFQVILNLDVFPLQTFVNESAYYVTQRMNEYGIPLDDRATFAKADWQMWAGAFATDDEFQAIVDAIFAFANVTPNRVPFTDWYDTIKATQNGFQARPVVGGFFARMLTIFNLPE